MERLAIQNTSVEKKQKNKKKTRFVQIHLVREWYCECRFLPTQDFRENAVVQMQKKWGTTRKKEVAGKWDFIYHQYSPHISISAVDTVFVGTKVFSGRKFVFYSFRRETAPLRNVFDERLSPIARGEHRREYAEHCDQGAHTFDNPMAVLISALKKMRERRRKFGNE